MTCPPFEVLGPQPAEPCHPVWPMGFCTWTLSPFPTLVFPLDQCLSSSSPAPSPEPKGGRVQHAL